MADQRRAGDWTHKSQRTREQANTIVESPGAKPWYQQVFWIVVLLLVFWPAGLILMWRSTWPLPVKIIVTILLAGIVYLSYSMWTVVQASMG